MANTFSHGCNNLFAGTDSNEGLQEALDKIKNGYAMAIPSCFFREKTQDLNCKTIILNKKPYFICASVELNCCDFDMVFEFAKAGFAGSQIPQIPEDADCHLVKLLRKSYRNAQKNVHHLSEGPVFDVHSNNWRKNTNVMYCHTKQINVCKKTIMLAIDYTRGYDNNKQILQCAECRLLGNPEPQYMLKGINEEINSDDNLDSCDDPESDKDFDPNNSESDDCEAEISDDSESNDGENDSDLGDHDSTVEVNKEVNDDEIVVYVLDDSEDDSEDVVFVKQIKKINLEIIPSSLEEEPDKHLMSDSEDYVSKKPKYSNSSDEDADDESDDEYSKIKHTRKLSIIN